MEQRISEWMGERSDLQGLNIKVMKWQDRPDKGAWGGDTVYVLKDLWSTYSAQDGVGLWDYQGDAKWTIPQWAISTYLRSMSDPLWIDDGGADHNILGGCLDLNGNAVQGKGMLYASTGISTFDLSKWTMMQTKRSGFACIEMFAGDSSNPGSLYYPDQGKQGPWAWCPFGLSDVVYGAGMPYKHHVSFFAVWQEVNKNVVPDVPSGSQFDTFLPIITRAADGIDRMATEMKRFNDYIMRVP